MHKLIFAWKGNIVSFFFQPPIVGGPIFCKLLPGLFLLVGQGKLKRGINPLQCLVQDLHGDDTVVILAQDRVDPATQMEDRYARRACQGQQNQQGRDQQEQNPRSKAKSHRVIPLEGEK